MRRLLSIFILPMVFIAAQGAPSRMRPVTAVSPSGDTLTVIAVGDEHSHHFIDATSGVKVDWMPNVEHIKSTPAMRARAKSTHRITGFPTKGELPFLVVLVEFKDKAFSVTSPADYFHRHLNQTGFADDKASGCVAEYYRDCSDGQFRPQFDVCGPVVMSHDYSYYGSSASDDSPAMKMVVEAATALDGEVDFSRYDIDGDGYVDNVYFYYAGLGQADGGDSHTIWPHSWDLESKSMQIELDGVTLNSYACSPELDGSHKPNGIGTFCHEFAHVLGLPDLYGGTYSGALDPANWSLMASGNYVDDGRTPPALSSYERYELGWLTPKELTYPLDVELQPLGIPDEESQSPYRACRIGTERTNEYFLLENRQQTGWDAHLPGHGMLVWHIDYNANIWDRNVVNHTASHQYVDIVEANNATAHSQDAGFPFPGTSKVTSLTSSTSPALRSWSGQAIDLPLTEITETGETITFKVAGGKTPVGKVEHLLATSIGPNFVDLQWDSATAAERYIISVDGVEHSTVRTTSAHIDGLKPLSDYNFTVAAADAYEVGPVAVVGIVTAAPTFEWKSPGCPEVSALTDTSVLLAWEPLADEDTDILYFVELSTIEDGDATTESFGFDGRALPHGWIGEGISWYSVAGYYGDSAPAIAASYPTASLIVPSFSVPVRNISFFARAISTDEAFVDIIGREDGSHIVAGPVTKVGRVHSVECINGISGSIEIRFSTPSSGRIVLDDLTFEIAGETETAFGASPYSVGHDKAITIEGLIPSTRYAASVYACNSDGVCSMHSARAVFTTNDNSGIINVTQESDADLPVHYYRLDGTETTHPTSPGIYIERRGTSVRKIACKH